MEQHQNNENVSKETKETQLTGNENTANDSYDLCIPHSLINNGECNVLLQIDPEDSVNLDLEGATGAIGRFEVAHLEDDDTHKMIFDLKGRQYSGVILSGPTAMVVSLDHGNAFGRKKETENPSVRVEVITDELCHLSETQKDVMTKLDAIVHHGNMDEEYDYKIQEDNVNTVRKNENNDKDNTNNTKQKTNLLKNKRGASNEKTPSKRRKKVNTKKR